MSKANLVENLSIRVNLKDMQYLKDEASKKRMPVATFCRHKLFKDVENYV